MQVRVFESTDMASGLKMVKKELGPDALILSTKTVRNGKLGILGKQMFEITAAIDSVDPPGAATAGPKRHIDKTPPAFTMEPTANSSSGSKRSAGAFSQVVDESLEQYLNHSQPDLTAEQQHHDRTTVRQAAPENGKNLQTEVNELKDLVKSLAGQISQLSTSPQNQPPVPQPVHPTPMTISSEGKGAAMFHDNTVVAQLMERGVNLPTARNIGALLRQNFSDSELDDSGKGLLEIRKTIENLIAVEPPQLDNDEKQHRIALVGPTGVGKTTTLAKLAAFYLANHSSSIALVTIDTYRIAAVEQLKIYGELMRLPVEVVISPEQLNTVLAKHSDKDLILIDTAGRSPKDRLCIDELSTFLQPELAIDKHLVVSAATRERELFDIIERFGNLDISKTIFTKLDECTNLGVLLNVQTQNSSPLSYVTNGQRVPEDFLEISPQIIAELIMSQYEGSTND